MTEFLPPSLNSLREVAQEAVQSGFYAIKQPQQAFMQLLVARDLGIPPTSALSNVHVVSGKPVLSANLMRALVKRSGKYDYRIEESTAQRCVIEWLSVDDGEPLGTSEFTMQQAERAGVTRNPTWKRYPEAMLLARATAVGVRMHCPDVLMGSVYVEGELDEEPVPVQVETVSDREGPQLVQGEDASVRSAAPLEREWSELFDQIPSIGGRQQAISLWQRAGTITQKEQAIAWLRQRVKAQGVVATAVEVLEADGSPVVIGEGGEVTA